MCTFLCMSLQFAVEPQQVMQQRACRQLSVVKTWLYHRHTNHAIYQHYFANIICMLTSRVDTIAQWWW